MLNLSRIAPGFLIGGRGLCRARRCLRWHGRSRSASLLAFCWQWTRALVPVAAALIGGAWLWFNADAALQQRLPAAPRWSRCANANRSDRAAGTTRAPDSLRGPCRPLRRPARRANPCLNWYAPAPDLPGDHRGHRATVASARSGQSRRLRPERHALTERIAAVGYVRTGEVVSSHVGGLDRLRGRIAGRIDARVADPTIASLLRALAIGDVRGLRDDDWDAACYRNRSSGRDLGPACRSRRRVRGPWSALLYRLFPPGLRWPRPRAMAVGALITATAYALLAGFGVPVVRTLLMIAVASSATLLRRRIRSVDAVLIAAFVIKSRSIR